MNDGITIKNEAALPVVSSYTIPPNTTFCAGDQINLNVRTNSTALETYVWKLGGVVKLTKQSGATNSSDYSATNATVADAGTYTIDITNKCGTVNAAASIPVTVNPTPTVTAQAATICSGAAFSVAPINGSGNIVPTGTTYSWSAPVIAGIIPIKSLILIPVLSSPDCNRRLSAVLTKFSKAVILNRALTPLFTSTNSLLRASNTICSRISFANSGIKIVEDCLVSSAASCEVIVFAI